MRKKLPICLVLLLSIFTLSVHAQSMNITGKVTEQNGDPLYGVNVTLKGTSQGTVTNDKGAFSITANKGATLTFSYIGFQPQDVIVGNSSVINIKMNNDANALNEVVVTALGIVKEKKALGYSVSEVKGDELTKARTVNVANSLQGKVAGLNITGAATGPGASTRITLRGNGSIGGNNQPLIVVDGIPINNDNLGSAGMWGGKDAGDGISSLNPDDIETFSVLKGATAAALYGSRASNGAILVTTKGGKAGKGIGVDFSTNFVLETPVVSSLTDYQYQYGMGLQGVKPATQAEAYAAGMQSWGAKLDGSSVIQFDGVSRPYSAVKDNFKNFYNNGQTLTNSLALSGATEKVTYRLSYYNMGNKGIVPNNTLDRNNFSLNTNGTLSKRLSFVANGKYFLEKGNNRSNLSDSPKNPNTAIYQMPTSLSVATLKANKLDANGYENRWQPNEYIQNPYFAAENVPQFDTKKRFIGAIEPKYNITDWLFAKARIGVDNFNFRNTDIEPYGLAFKIQGGMNVGNRNFTETNMSLDFGANKKLTDVIGINAIVGGNLMKQVTIFDGYGGNNFNIPFFNDISNINPANRSVSYGYSERRINSVYGSTEFSYKDYLYLTATARNDWFSTLSSANRSILYPSAGLSFVLSEAVKLPSLFNYAKLRTTWAQAGGDTDPYQLNLNYGLNGVHLNQPLASIAQGQVPNANLKPLTSTTFEAGFETKMLNNRLGLDFAYYNRVTTDDIVAASISSTSGYGSALFNIGKIKNSGIELLLNALVVKSNDFEFDASFNIAYNNNEVLKLSEGSTTLQVDQSRTMAGRIHQEVGQPFSLIKGFAFKRDAAGNIVHNTQGRPLQGEYKSFGSGVSPITTGLTLSARYKGFGLSTLFDGKFGGYIYSASNAYAYNNGLHKNTLVGREGGIVGEGVNEKGEKNTVNISAQDYYKSIAFSFAEPFVYSSDFIKLRQVILDYAIPSRVLTKMPFKAASVSLVGRNLAILFKKTPNIDPESVYNTSNAQGLELSGVPTARSMGVSLNLKF